MVVNSDNKRNLRSKELELQKQSEESKSNEAKKNSNFVILYRDHIPELRWLMKKSGIASGILHFILEHMDYKNALICPSSVLEDYFDISRTTTHRDIKLLKDNGFIDVLKMGTSNVYIINQEIAWSSWENQKQYCKFNGNVLISAKENKDYVYESQSDKFNTVTSAVEATSTLVSLRSPIT